ncbi:hypothetical protein ONR75_15875 [Rhodopseudomonas sp. P2A-2r]|uniref:phage adaptor protein n=1 Tax=Rhodopseudomonas sp. P2A-2r TaxID=2991972 RepID=UPI002233F355|nr:hypothetical protein [Rhodopseudomonas sp. P2A-2r]UZE51909.1 hypothetical protein ONR75_15875 [Rhodopseudomonas sp. P2A-2r]
MTTLLDLQTAIATDLTRPDLTSQIASAVKDAIRFYERKRFWFNVTRSKTFVTVPGQSTYTAADMAEIPNIVRVEKLFLYQPGTIFALDREEPDDFEWLVGGSTGPGKPTVFTYVDQAIQLWPVPNAVFTMRPHMHYKFAPLALPTDTNAWCTDAEELIRTHAKLLLYTDLLEDPDGAGRMQSKIQALKDALDYETSARTATGQIRGTDF